MTNGDEVWIVGIAMTKFGKHPDKDAVDLGYLATTDALRDAGMGMSEIGLIAAGNMLGEHNFGQSLQKQTGQTGVPVINVTNACATGATALKTAIMAVRSGECRAAMAVGVEKIAGAGLLVGGEAAAMPEEWRPTGRVGAVAALDGTVGTDTMPGVFALVGMEYAARNPEATFEVFARISEKNHAHSTLNPLAAYTRRFTLDEIMNDVMVAYPNTRPMCSANCDGAAAAIVVSGDTLRAMDPTQRRRAVKISASVLATDPWTDGCQVLPDVSTVTQRAATQAYELAGVGPDDLDLVELHDCFATAELVHYENLHLCAPGEAVAFFESGAPTRDGRMPVNVSGGLQSKGHPISATGIANIWEVCHHLRGEAGARQIAGARVGLAHVIGLGSSCGVHILERAA